MSLVCCDQLNEKCMFGACSACKTKVDEFLHLNFDVSSVTIRNKWKEIEGFLQVAEEKKEVAAVVNELNQEITYFKKHCFIKNQQPNYFESCKEAQNPLDAVVQIDFSENASLTSQNEIQSAH
ncbi:unnamed protein product [Brassicogethes aeneus]|uniref:Uncharacterized protein n=1 Tax=Brassicogethes aeneus TaxID=1431903 RepID=A0A9P0FD41_BRAAE|nr:unnamed protein product [Brassicogethes aeneus]